MALLLEKITMSNTESERRGTRTSAIVKPLVRCVLAGCLLSAASSAYASTWWNWWRWWPPQPEWVRIHLDHPGVVADFTFKVRKRDFYRYSLTFGFPKDDAAEKERVRQLLGDSATGRPVAPGVPTPVHLSIFSLDKDGREVEVLSTDADPSLPYQSWEDFGKNTGRNPAVNTVVFDEGWGYFGREIGHGILLAPGMYRARLVSKRASPEFSAVPIFFRVSRIAKS